VLFVASVELREDDRSVWKEGWPTFLLLDSDTTWACQGHFEESRRPVKSSPHFWWWWCGVSASEGKFRPVEEQAKVKDFGKLWYHKVHNTNMSLDRPS
jgi:hypothetical protein